MPTRSADAGRGSGRSAPVRPGPPVLLVPVLPVLPVLVGRSRR